jgi:hypothetical protein
MGHGNNPLARQVKLQFSTLIAYMSGCMQNSLNTKSTSVVLFASDKFPIKNNCYIKQYLRGCFWTRVVIWCRQNRHKNC